MCYSYDVLDYKSLCECKKVVSDFRVKLSFPLGKKQNKQNNNKKQKQKQKQKKKKTKTKTKKNKTKKKKTTTF